MKRLITDHVRYNKKIYLFLLSLFSLGALLGCLFTRYMNQAAQQALLSDLTSFFSSAMRTQQVFSRNDYFKMNLVSEIKMYFILWLSGLTFLGFAAGPIYAFSQGFVLGFSNSFLLMHYQTRGFFYSMLTVMPQNLIKIPALFYACASLAAYTLQHSGKGKVGRNASSSLLISYTAAIACALAISIIGVFIESFISPSLIFVFAPEML
ncbi:MAG: stage II sporulation protein M [Eubacteriaceae bacterium]|nr:stage II sporulation protein M [Eubacteriaceae bacterium]